MIKKLTWKEKLFENGSYKIVALFVTLVLWVAILGRKDLTIYHEMALALRLPQGTVVQNHFSPLVKVKIAGPRLALKKFLESNKEITIDLSEAGTGHMTIRLQENDLTVPNGVRVMTISPGFLALDIVRSDR